MPDSAPTSPLLSPASIHGSLYGSLTAPPEVNNVAETLAAMKGSLGNLGQLFDALGHQATQMVQIGGELETAQHLNKVRKEMVAQDKKQEEQIEDIKALLEQALQYEIIEHLRTIIEQGVLDQIDELVKEQVAEQLPTYFPQEIEEELTLYRQQLDEVQRAFHNSESRRSNSLLRSDKLSDPLHTIYKTDGTVSGLFPKDVRSLFSMDVETSQQLMQEYELPDITNSREKNVNRFMQFCGVTYQLVRRGF